MLIKHGAWFAAEHRRTLLVATAVICPRRVASGGGGGLDASGKHHDDDEIKMEKQVDFYRPGSDSYAYENPWPKLNKGRFDWLFKDGWRRPLATDQGGHLRRQWLWMMQFPHDEHKDWHHFHKYMFILNTVLTVWFSWWFMLHIFPDWPQGREWAHREAHLEVMRRQKAGLPLISPDLIERSRVEASLPSEEELRDFEIVV